MVTHGDRCSLRCNRVVLFYTRVLGSSFISFCWFCFESNFRKTPEAIEYKNFVILPKKKISGILTPRFIISRELTQTVAFTFCIKHEFLLIAYIV